MYFAICENRSFRDKTIAETAAAKALADMLGLEDDGTPIFPDGYTGFDDDKPSDASSLTTSAVPCRSPRDFPDMHALARHR